MKITARDIITMPTQIIEQGTLGDTEFESPMQFQAYNGCISIEQDGRFINLHTDAVEAFVKALRNFKKVCYPKV